MSSGRGNQGGSREKLKQLVHGSPEGTPPASPIQKLPGALATPSAAQGADGADDDMTVPDIASDIQMTAMSRAAAPVHGQIAEEKAQKGPLYHVLFVDGSHSTYVNSLMHRLNENYGEGAWMVIDAINTDRLQRHMLGWLGPHTRIDMMLSSQTTADQLDIFVKDLFSCFGEHKPVIGQMHVWMDGEGDIAEGIEGNLIVHSGNECKKLPEDRAYLGICRAIIRHCQKIGEYLSGSKDVVELFDGLDGVINDTLNDPEAFYIGGVRIDGPDVYALKGVWHEDEIEEVKEERYEGCSGFRKPWREHLRGRLMNAAEAFVGNVCLPYTFTLSNGAERTVKGFPVNKKSVNAQADSLTSTEIDTYISRTFANLVCKGDVEGAKAVFQMWEGICEEDIRKENNIDLDQGFSKEALEKLQKRKKIILDQSSGPIAGYTPLFYAAIDGNDEMAQFLLEKGADANAMDTLGNTPLLFAASHNHGGIVHLLLKYEADPNRGNLFEGIFKDGKYDSVEIAKRFEEKGNYKRAIHWAAEKGYAGIVASLIIFGADVNAKDKDGKTPLMHAIQIGDKDLVQLLLEQGADPNIGYDKDDIHVTPLMLAAIKCGEFPEQAGRVVNLLLDNGADPRVKLYPGNKFWRINHSVEWVLKKEFKSEGLGDIIKKLNSKAEELDAADKQNAREAEESKERAPAAALRHPLSEDEEREREVKETAGSRHVGRLERRGRRPSIKPSAVAPASDIIQK